MLLSVHRSYTITVIISHHHNYFFSFIFLFNILLLHLCLLLYLLQRFSRLLTSPHLPVIVPLPVPWSSLSFSPTHTLLQLPPSLSQPPSLPLTPSSIPPSPHLSLLALIFTAQLQSPPLGLSRESSAYLLGVAGKFLLTLPSASSLPSEVVFVISFLVNVYCWLILSLSLAPPQFFSSPSCDFFFTPSVCSFLLRFTYYFVPFTLLSFSSWLWFPFLFYPLIFLSLFWLPFMHRILSLVVGVLHSDFFPFPVTLHSFFFHGLFI